MKINTAWAVQNMNDEFYLPTVRRKRADAIRAFEVHVGVPWRKCKGMGFSCVKVEIRRLS